MVERVDCVPHTNTYCFCLGNFQVFKSFTYQPNLSLFQDDSSNPINQLTLLLWFPPKQLSCNPINQHYYCGSPQSNSLVTQLINTSIVVPPKATLFKFSLKKVIGITTIQTDDIPIISDSSMTKGGDFEIPFIVTPTKHINIVDLADDNFSESNNVLDSSLVDIRSAKDGVNNRSNNRIGGTLGYVI